MRLVISSILLAAAACGGDSGPDTIREDLPPVASDATRLVSPTFNVPAGKEVFECMRFPADTSQDMYINASEAYQVTGGHHSMLYYSDKPTGGDEPHESSVSALPTVSASSCPTASR
jgi:hypothetical protein